MRFSSTISIYLVKNLLLNLLYVFLCFMFISFILELLELIRKIQGKEIYIFELLKIAFYKVPFLMFSFLPFIFLFGSILSLTKLNNNFEIAAIKSLGISIWSMCIPLVGTVIIISIFILWVLQPISAVFLDKNRLLENKYFGYKSNRVSLNTNGIWLYDQYPVPSEEKFIHISYPIKDGKLLYGVNVYLAGENKDFTISYSAKSASLKYNLLILNDVLKYEPGSPPVHYNQLELPSNLVSEQIQENIVNPEIIPIWNLKEFIDQIKQSGFSTLKHELYYQSLLAAPLLYISLILIAISCSISLPRKGRVGVVFIIGSLVTVFIFFVEKMVNVMALTSILPINIAVLAPSITYLFLSAATLIHYEEG